MRKIKVLGAMVLIVCLIFAVSSCQKDKTEGETAVTEVTPESLVVPADVPWYEPSIIVAGGTDYSPDEITRSEYDFIGGTPDGGYVIFSTGSYPGDLNVMSFIEYNFMKLSIISNQGDIEIESDICALIDELCRERGIAYTGFSNTNSTISDDLIHMFFEIHNEGDNYINKYELQLDIETLGVIAFAPLDAEVSQTISVKSSYVIGSHQLVITLDAGDYFMEYYAHVYENGEEKGSICLEDYAALGEAMEIQTIPIGENQVILCVWDECDTLSSVVLDLSTMNVVPSNRDLSFLDRRFLRETFTYSEGVGTVYADEYGIGMIDFENNMLTELITFDNTNVNRNQFTEYEILSYTSDKVVLVGKIHVPYPGDFNREELRILTLTRMDANPHEGKTILRIAAIGDVPLSDSTCEAVVEFNNVSENSIIFYDTRYEISKTILNNSDEAYKASLLQEVNNRLSIDIISGNGPDIIVNAFQNSSLNNDTYLMDLSSYVPEGANQHVIDLCKEEDKLYQMPTSYCLQGFMVLPSTMEEGSIGFTYDEYISYVDEVMNGEDLFPNQSKLDIINMEISMLYNSLLDSEGKLDLQSERFIQMVNFVKDGIVLGHFDQLDIQEYIDQNEMNGEDLASIYGERDYYYELSRTATFVTSGNCYDWIDLFERRRLVGLPSDEERGGGIYVSESIGISSVTPSSEDALLFLNACLEDSSQRLISNEFPIKNDILDEIIMASIEETNAFFESILQYLSPEEAAAALTYVDSVELYDESYVQDLHDMIDSTSYVYRNNPDVMAVLSEELPAFFEDQKTLDEVIVIIEDRINTMSEEQS